MTLNDKPLRELLSLLSKHEVHDSVWWDEDCGFFVNCNDIFDWACSDAESITEENIPILRQSLEDCESDSNGMLLFCCRSRGTRPQGAVYKFIEKRFWPLFDACGPERPISFGNPVDRNSLEVSESKP